MDIYSDLCIEPEAYHKKDHCEHGIYILYNGNDCMSSN